MVIVRDSSDALVVEKRFVHFSPPPKAPEGWRTPRRFALFGYHRPLASVLDCGGPPPLFVRWIEAL